MLEEFSNIVNIYLKEIFVYTLKSKRLQKLNFHFLSITIF